MLLCRFYVNKDKCNNDYRPVIWPISYPYWCTGESETSYILMAYVDTIDKLYEQWPEVENVNTLEKDIITFSDRFPKPDWYNNN